MLAKSGYAIPRVAVEGGQISNLTLSSYQFDQSAAEAVAISYNKLLSLFIYRVSNEYSYQVPDGFS
jgi:hypothetical protein